MFSSILSSLPSALQFESKSPGPGTPKAQAAEQQNQHQLGTKESTTTAAADGDGDAAATPRTRHSGDESAAKKKEKDRKPANEVCISLIIIFIVKFIDAFVYPFSMFNFMDLNILYWCEWICTDIHRRATTPREIESSAEPSSPARPPKGQRPRSSLLPTRIPRPTIFPDPNPHNAHSHVQRARRRRLAHAYCLEPFRRLDVLRLHLRLLLLLRRILQHGRIATDDHTPV